MVTSEITETVDAVTKTGLLILAEIRRGELITQMAVTGTGTEALRTCKQCTNDLWMYLGLQNMCFLIGCWFSTVEEMTHRFLSNFGLDIIDRLYNKFEKAKYRSETFTNKKRKSKILKWNFDKWCNLG